MAAPTLLPPAPPSGPTSGGDLVLLTGTGFAERVAVRFGNVSATVLWVRQEGGQSVAQVRTPEHDEAVVGVTLANLDAAGAPVPSETITLAGAYRFLRPRIVQEADLTRLVRTLSRELKRQVLLNVSASVAVDFDDTTQDIDLIAVAKVPSLVLSGPRLRENRFYSSNILHEQAVQGSSGPEIVRRRPPLTVDLEFRVTGASDRTAELFNLVAAVASFANRNRWLSMPRDPANLAAGSVRWEMDLSGELQTTLESKDDIRAFTWGLVVRGFDVDEGLPMDRGRALASDPELETRPLGETP